MIKKICCLLVMLPLAAVAQVSPERLDQLAAEAQPQVVEWRRWFHQNPELSNREFKTSEKVAEILRGMGLEPITGIAHTGMIAVIEGGKPGPLVAIRSDMDGLPVIEQTGLPFASTAKDVYNGQDVGVMQPNSRNRVDRRRTKRATVKPACLAAFSFLCRSSRHHP